MGALRISIAKIMADGYAQKTSLRLFHDAVPIRIETARHNEQLYGSSKGESNAAEESHSKSSEGDPAETPLPATRQNAEDQCPGKMPRYHRGEDSGPDEAAL